MEPLHNLLYACNMQNTLHGHTPGRYASSSTAQRSRSFFDVKQRPRSPADFLLSYYHVSDLLNKQINHTKIDYKITFMQGGGKHIYSEDIFPQVTPTPVLKARERLGSLK